MPVYEFYCETCHVIFNFHSSSVNTSKRPTCPKCKVKKLKRLMSMFAYSKGAREDRGMDDLPIDASKMEKAMEVVTREAEAISVDDPRQAAKLMRKVTDVAGARLGPGMEETVRRMEAGEDPELIEAEMGDLIEQEEPFIFEGKNRGRTRKRRPPRHDEKLYPL